MDTEGNAGIMSAIRGAEAGTLVGKVCSTQQAAGVAAGLIKIGTIADDMKVRLQGAVKQIEKVNMQTRLLSFNARIEAAHAGEAGRGFEIVAKEMVTLSDCTAEAAARLDSETQEDVSRLGRMIDEVSAGVRGTRLSDLAYTNIDLIDRNLYERSCDVRWWATDSSCVDACLDPSKVANASHRLGVILDSYTVYYDIVLCDITGRVIANGRPGSFSSVGTIQAETEWFRSAMQTASGREFGFQGMHQSSTLAGNQRVLVYSALVREGGLENGKPIGCLGIVFNWDALAQTIVDHTQLGEAEKPTTQVCIVDNNGHILATSDWMIGVALPLNMSSMKELIQCRKGFMAKAVNGVPYLVAYAGAPGYETYTTGWHSFIFQRMAM